jgi:prepilin-type N-terminal cleavage/methylation domain-containing protein
MPHAVKRCSCRARAGVTLVEMMIVIVLIGILTAIAMPRVDTATYTMRAGTQALGSSIASVQRLAVVRQHDIIVGFDAANRRIRIHEDRNNNGNVDTGEHVRLMALEEGMVFGRGGAPAYLTFTQDISLPRTIEGLPSIVFTRSGSASDEGAFYVTSRRAANGGGRAHHARVIHITRATGRISWFNWNSSTWRREF